MFGELTEAKKYLDASFGDYGQEINTQRAQAAALIAIAEQMVENNKHLSDIRCHLADLLTIFSNAEGPDGAIKVAQ